MRLFVPKDHLNSMDRQTVDIYDEDTNDAVGELKYEKGVGRHVILFGRYKGTFASHEECAAFVKGVEEVLTYMID